MGWKDKQKERMNGFSFYYSYYDVAQDLTNKQRLEFYDAIMAFIFEGEDREETLSKSTKIAFKGIKSGLVLSKQRSISGSSKPKSNANQNEIKIVTSSSSSSSSSSRPNGKQTPGGGDVENPAPPVCPKCHRISAPNPETGKWECPECGRKLGWVKYA